MKFNPNKNEPPEILGLDYYDGYLSGFATAVDNIGTCYFHAIAKKCDRLSDTKYDILFVVVPVEKQMVDDISKCFPGNPEMAILEAGGYLYENRDDADRGRAILEECRARMRTSGSFMLSGGVKEKRLKWLPIDPLLMDDVERAMLDELECPDNLDDWLPRLTFD